MMNIGVLLPFYFLSFYVTNFNEVGDMAFPILSTQEINSTVVPTEPPVDTIPDTFPGLGNENSNPYDLNDPQNVVDEVKYDPTTGRYIISKRIGDEYIGAPTYMTFSEYLEYRRKQDEKKYFDQIAGISTGSEESSTGLEDPLQGYKKDVELLNRLFGSDEIDIRPQGNVDIGLGFRYQKMNNPNLLVVTNNRVQPDFNVDINVGVTGQIGEKLSLNTNFNTKSQFDFDKQIKLKFDSDAFSEDDIIKKIEAGNVSLPLRSNLIQGAQSLFGLKVESQWGHLNLTTIISQQKSRKKQLRIENGAQTQYYELRADEYDENRHFFLSHFNRGSYEEALKNLPQINSLMKITRMEVWVTNIRDETQGLRDILALTDLGEAKIFAMNNPDPFLNTGPVPRDISGNQLPSNDANLLYEQLIDDDMAKTISTSITRLRNRYNLVPGRDFELKRAKKLELGEFSFHPQLGFISLNVPLRPDEVLAVAFEYDYNGETYTVGQLDSDNQIDSVSNELLFVKLLKGNQSTIGTPMWDLMMKNVYPVGAYQSNREDFFLDVYYDDAGKGFKRFLPEPGEAGQPLLQLFNLDNLNVQGDPVSDGRFDYVPGVTILPQSGKVIFPVLEPFGSTMQDQLGDQLYQKYGFPELYDSTLAVAQEYQEKNRFLLKGNYQSSVSSEISLGTFNLPQGSVTVRAGGRVLQENIDYEVDYQIGIVRIINESILAGGTPIDVSYEDNTLFSFDQKSMFGLRAQYEISRSLSVGATYMHLWEKPFTQKVNIGDDPISNRIFGLDLLYEDEAPWLTKLVDKIPGIDTKEESNVSAYFEGAYLKPGHAKGIEPEGETEGTVYVDDFEGATGEITLISPLDRWTIASIPQHERNSGSSKRFPESELNNDLRSGMNRALINLYQINIYGGNQDRESSSVYDRLISQTEIFPNRTLIPGQNFLRTMDIAYYPTQRGPYNFDPPGGTEYSAGLNADGTLRDPESRWGGMMRELITNDFQQVNIEYIEFWMLNPFIGSDETVPGSEGTMLINLGNVSEDILKDGISSYENGLPRKGERLPMDTSVYGIATTETPYVYAFSNTPEDRPLQDLGFDGMSDSLELIHFEEYLDKIEHETTPTGERMETDFIAKTKADPSNDNFKNWDDEAYSNIEKIIPTYMAYNGSQGNTPISNPNDRYPKNSTIRPDTEDINRDYTSDQIENYFSYEIPIKRDELNPNTLKRNKYIIDSIQTSGTGEIWYRFKIPVQQYDEKVGNIQDFRSVRFMRMYFTEFDEPTIFRFAAFDLVRNQWRRFQRNNLLVESAPDTEVSGETTFDVNEVSIEENSEKTPFPYVLPPGIQRERNFQTTSTQTLFNEQSIALNVCELSPGRARAVFKNTQRDLRVYDRMHMFVHAEGAQMEDLKAGDAKLFLRFGSDYTRNYYEYEMPLTPSDLDAERGDPFNVWRPENNLDIALKLLTDAKIERNRLSFPLNQVYEIENPEYPGHIIRIKGNPNLGYIKGFMIGLSNAKDEGNLCVEVWVNELRVSGLAERGGLAGIARADFQMADFGNVTFSGNYSTIGWGGLEQALDDRAKEEILEYDISANLQLDKFLPEEAAVNAPVYAQYSQSIKTPQFDPYDLDVGLKEKLAATQNTQDRDSIRNQALDVTTIKSLNVTNLSKNYTGEGQPKPWSISNFSASYGFTEVDHHDPLLEFDNTVNHNGSFIYRYSYKPLYIEPFKKLIQNEKYLKFIKEIHFNFLPNSFGHNSSVDRTVNVRKYRFSRDYSTWYDRQFSWNRSYNLTWDLTRNLNFNYTATNYSVIDELNNEGETIFGETPQGISRNEYLWNNIKGFGRNKDYNHGITASYQVPFNNFPFLDFISLRAQTRVDYAWNRSAVNVDSLGNTIQNGQRHSLNGNLSFDRLYSKIPYFRKLTSSGSSRRGSSRRTPRGGNTVTDNKDKKKRGSDRKITVAEHLLVRPLLMLKTARAKYNLSYNSVIPGYFPETELIGMNPDFTAPGWEYILGFSPEEQYLFDAAENKGWLTASRYLSQDLIKGRQENWSFELNLEPWRDVNIDVNMDKTHNITNSYLFKNHKEGIGFENFMDAEYRLDRRNAFGTYSISYLAINTLFEDKLTDITALFDTYESYRPTISKRLNPNGVAHATHPKYMEGYGPKQPEVLIPAFIAAYTNQSPNDVKTNLFNQAPLPNWNLSYNGLSRLPFFKDIFNNFSLSHAYSSTMTVNSFQANGQYVEENPLSEDNLNDDFNYYSEYYFPELIISEKLSPLIGLSFKTKNDIQFDVDYSKLRELSLNFTNSFLHERRSEKISINFGYLIKDVNIEFLSFELDDLVSGRGRSNRRNRNRSRGKVSRGQDMNINCAFSYSDDITMTHQLDLEKSPSPERGMETLSVNPTMAYDMNEYMNLQAFYEYSYSRPATSQSFPITNMRGGLRLRFKLQ